MKWLRPSRSREAILQNLARFLQKRVILQDGGYLARSCKIEVILKESCKNLARILQDNHPKISVEKHKKITETRCKIKKILFFSKLTV